LTISGAVVLLSAGLDSVVAFKLAVDTYDEIACLTFDYGQKAHSVEIEYAAKICSMYHVAHQVIKLPWYTGFVGALTTDTQLPQLKGKLMEDIALTRETASLVWVPARNAVFLSVAAAFCENYGYEAVVVGFNKEEAETFPDNSANFVASFNQALEYGTLNKVEVRAPLIEYEKTEIAALGLNIGAPLEWSWSCYGAQDTPCHVCESCVRRSRAFERIRKKDPLLIRLKKL
jgi:7-cyano-7-deazaguanine synthase